MLQHTFIHAQGIGPGTEARLWRRGARDWQSFLALHAAGTLAGGRFDALAPAVRASHAALERRDVAYFGARLPGAEHWRLYEEFADLAAFVDIETTGLARAGDDITVIAVHVRGRTWTLVRGRDLERFPEVVADYPLLVTFNGASFDLPFLADRFRGFRPRAHVDLRYPLKRLGYAGGLKLVEQQAGIRRPAHLREVDGWEAVRLWHDYQRGNRAALDLLLEYARHDVENLPPLACLVATERARALGFAQRTCRWGGL
jgi:hypothetical protein